MTGLQLAILWLLAAVALVIVLKLFLMDSNDERNEPININGNKWINERRLAIDSAIRRHFERMA